MDDFMGKQLVKVKFTCDAEETKFKESLDYFKVSAVSPIVPCACVTHWLDGDNGLTALLQGGYDSEESFAELDKALAAKEAPGADRLYFLSVPPTVFGAVCTCINSQSRARAPGKTQVLVEKPFGRDSRTFMVGPI